MRPGALARLAYYLNVVQATMRGGRYDLRLKLIRTLWSSIEDHLPSS